MKLTRLFEEVVRTVCGQCQKPMGQKVVKPAIGAAATQTGIQSKQDNSQMCPQCMKKMDVDKPFNTVQDRTSDALSKVTTTPGGPSEAPENTPNSGKMAPQFKPMSV